MTISEQIMDHNFVSGFCTKCARSRTELVAYGAPSIEIEVGNSGLSCSGTTNASEIESLRAAWRKDRETKWDKIFGW